MAATLLDPTVTQEHVNFLRAQVASIDNLIIEESVKFKTLCIDMLGCSEADAAETETRLESNGADPKDTPFMRTFAASRAARLADKSEKEQALQQAEAILAEAAFAAEVKARQQSTVDAAKLVPYWPPTARESVAEPSMRDLLFELRSLRFLNEQLLVRVSALEKSRK